MNDNPTSVLKRALEAVQGGRRWGWDGKRVEAATIVLPHLQI